MPTPPENPLSSIIDPEIALCGNLARLAIDNNTPLQPFYDPQAGWLCNFDGNVLTLSTDEAAMILGVNAETR